MARKNKRDTQHAGILRLVLGVILVLIILHNVDILDQGYTKFLASQNTNEEELQGNIDMPTSGDEMTVHFINVGQGDSALIEYKDIDILIDGGDNKAAKTVISYLDRQDIDDIDLIIGTHMDADHIGGLDKVMESYKVEQIIDSGTKKTTKTYKDYRTAIDAEGATYLADKDMGFQFYDALRVEIIETGDGYSHENDNSVVAKVSFGNMDFLFTGDMEKKAESHALNRFTDIEVLKVGHHGSRTSSSAEFLKLTMPEYAIISCGVSNKYGHPHKEALERLEGIGAEIYRTDTQGDIRIITDGYKIQVQE